MKERAASAVDPSPLVDLLDSAIETERDGLPQHLWERALAAPAREFLNRPGKQFRARLVAGAWSLVGRDMGSLPAVLPQILELLHAGSLIVDDIEDGAEIRRNAPALHHLYGVPQALNTGNWMYFWALRLIDGLPFEEPVRGTLTREACRAVEQCHRGQALDLAIRVTELEQSEVAKVVRTTTRLKTGALMELAAVLGAAAAGASPTQLRALGRFGRRLGKGLQMLDDLGGVSSPRRLHKGAEDLFHDRPTWPWAWLASTRAPDEYARYRNQLCQVVRGRIASDTLSRALAAAVAERGRRRVHSSLHRSLADLEAVFGEAPALKSLRDEIDRLERSYE